MERYSYNRQAASPIEVTDLPPDQQKFVKALARFGLKPVHVWDGIHGFIVDFEGGSPRMTKDFLQALTRNSDFRWVEFSSMRGDISVGM